MKHIKVLLYAQPGVGKSVFAGHAPSPLFFTTDGNYEYLEGLIPDYSENNCVRVTSWKQFKEKALDEKIYNGHETVVIDLLEDLFKWCEQEYCVLKGIEDVGDLGFAKGYTATRDDFFITISKVLAMDKNVILICHGLDVTVKDRRGVEHTKYLPTNRIPEKVLPLIEGRIQYGLRAFAKAEEDSDGNMVINRYLSLAPDGTTEWGVTRRLNANTCPKVIPLDWDTFIKVLEENAPKCEVKPTVAPTPVPATKAVVKEEVKVVEVPKVVEPKVVEKPVETAAFAEPVEEKFAEPVADPVIQEIVQPKVEVVEPKVEVVKPTVEAPKPVGNVVSGQDKLEALRAKLAAMKKQ